jgi:hypothetical protein
MMQSCVACDCSDAWSAIPAGAASAIKAEVEAEVEALVEAEVEALADVVEALKAAEVDVFSGLLVFWTADVVGRLASRLAGRTVTRAASASNSSISDCSQWERLRRTDGIVGLGFVRDAGTGSADVCRIAGAVEGGTSGALVSSPAKGPLPLGRPLPFTVIGSITFKMGNSSRRLRSSHQNSWKSSLVRALSSTSFSNSW